MIDLPVIDSCDGCGACCMEQSSPPGYVYLIAQPKVREDWDEDDVQRLDSLPIQARVILKKYMDLLGSNNPPKGERPCCWLNQETMQCRFYDHRPQICRDFERGTEGCHGWREEYSID